MLKNTLTIARVAGVPIGVHYTWLFAAALITWSLAQGFFPTNYPGWDPSLYWAAGVAGALGLFASVLIHELGHALVAIARGVAVKRITLFIFGGLAQFEEESEKPSDEFLIAVVGPVTSIALAAVAWGMGRLVPTGSTAAAVLSYLAFINALLAGFNLIPGFPLDGGRVLRALIWAISGSERRATQITSYAGQLVGYLLMFSGLSRLLAGDVLGGLWIGMIGLFLNGAAASAREQQTIKQRLRGVQVGELMDREPPVTGPETSLHEFVYLTALRQGKRAVLVARDGRLLGLASVSDVKECPASEWPTTPIARVMTPLPLKTVSPRTGLDEALRLLAQHELNQLPVVEGERVVGMLTRAHLLRYLQVSQTLGLDRPLERPPAGTASADHAASPSRDHSRAA